MLARPEIERVRVKIIIKFKKVKMLTTPPVK